YTLTWYRFATAGAALTAILAVNGRLPKVTSFSFDVASLLTVAFAGLLGNYVMYVIGLSYTSPSVAQTVTQLGPMFLLLGGLVVFKERFSEWQWLGLVILIIGLGLFFNQHVSELLHPTGGFGFGVGLFVLGSLTWAIYGLAQKRLLTWLGGQQIL